MLDIQGAGFTLFDPEIATRRNAVSDDGELKFYMGNLSQPNVDLFVSNHVCSKYCEIIGLKPISGSKRRPLVDPNIKTKFYRVLKNVNKRCLSLCY